MRLPIRSPLRRRPDEQVGRVLFAGQSFYHTWYLSRALRRLGWKADVLNWDLAEATAGYYHGEDFRLPNLQEALPEHLEFFERCLTDYDIFHFSNKGGLCFTPLLHSHLGQQLHNEEAEFTILRDHGKKIVYSNNGCLDGVTQTRFSQWGPWTVCDDCIWRDRPDVCSDELNTRWGRFRNSVVDLQIIVGGNRVEFNEDPTAHDVPQFYCLDPDVWRPDLEIPDEFRLDLPASTVRIYHAVGNYDARTNSVTGRNIKSTHIYVPLIERLKASGHDVELVFAKGMRNLDVRFVQAQADIVVDMLTFGFFGSNIREAMMLGKPAVCFLRPEWLESLRREVPGYVEELPVVSANPDTIEDVLTELICHPEKRAEIGRRSREFAVKWHSADAGARRMDELYRQLLNGGVPPVHAVPPC